MDVMWLLECHVHARLQTHVAPVAASPDVLGLTSTVMRLLLSAVKAANTTDGTNAAGTLRPAAAAAAAAWLLGAVTTGLRGHTCRRKQVSTHCTSRS